MLDKVHATWKVKKSEMINIYEAQEEPASNASEQLTYTQGLFWVFESGVSIDSVLKFYASSHMCL